MELLVPVLASTLTPVLRLAVAVLIVLNLTQFTDGDATDLVGDACTMMYRERVKEVAFPTGQLLTGTERTA
ncbi:MAG: hypothetical protein J07HQW2_03348 [Haloquadratum walsbyi J07HQW2]|uniref:Uncharacterized protein n=1 Tax=Haloquadratum walsbyi J07HQW2 TaxID=1238425 RepID=U1N1Z5_9EURY|nr:MAG: hypothetical protein J07HQW2_03348 [Haloquadratum walsbyi J07HQW2]